MCIFPFYVTLGKFPIMLPTQKVSVNFHYRNWHVAFQDKSTTDKASNETSGSIVWQITGQTFKHWPGRRVNTCMGMVGVNRKRCHKLGPIFHQQRLPKSSTVGGISRHKTITMTDDHKVALKHSLTSCYAIVMNEPINEIAAWLRLSHVSRWLWALTETQVGRTLFWLVLSPPPDAGNSAIVYRPQNHVLEIRVGTWVAGWELGVKIGVGKTGAKIQSGDRDRLFKVWLIMVH